MAFKTYNVYDSCPVEQGLLGHVPSTFDDIGGISSSSGLSLPVFDTVAASASFDTDQGHIVGNDGEE